MGWILPLIASNRKTEPGKSRKRLPRLRDPSGIVIVDGTEPVFFLIHGEYPFKDKICTERVKVDPLVRRNRLSTDESSHHDMVAANLLDLIGLFGTNIETLPFKLTADVTIITNILKNGD